MTAVTWNLTAMPLTPIHVGDGSFLAPEDYRLAPAGLERFAASAVLRDMGEAQRRNYMAQLDQGRLVDAWAILRSHVRPEHVHERLAISDASRGDLKRAMENPQARGELRPFIRTGGRPFIPGSSIKGAIRTALLSALAQPRSAEIERIKTEAGRTGRGELRGRASDEMQRLLLRYSSMDQDPFRFVRVGDVALPAGSTCVDRVVNWRPQRTGRSAAPATEIPMHYERVLARVDGAQARWELQIQLDLAQLTEARRRDQAKAPQYDLLEATLHDAVNAFHWRLWDAERERFFADERATMQRLDSSLRMRGPNGVVLDGAAIRASPHVLLLRIGRFGQFESKSVETFREGWNAQAKPPRSMTQGNTRNIVRIDGAPMPMGWLLLVPPGLQPAPVELPTVSQPRPADPRPTPARSASYQGEIVSIVGHDRGQVNVRFVNGDTEWVDETDLEWT